MGFLQNWRLRGKKSLATQRQADEILQSTISPSLATNLQTIRMLFSNIPELTIRNVSVKKGSPMALLYMDGLVDKNIINTDILRPLLQQETDEVDVLSSVVSVGKIEQVQNWSAIEQALLNGKSIVFIDAKTSAYAFHTQGWPQRAIQEPQVESSIKSAHQGFTEVANQNIAMIRRYIPSRELKAKEVMVGERGSIQLSLLYLADVVNQDALTEVEIRLKQLSVDTVLNTGELEGLIEDHTYTPFPQFILTERPDTTASHLLQGRVAVIVDRSPGALIGPMTFSSFFQTVDDYNVRWLTSSFVRILRFVGCFIAIFAPSIYIAMISFHYEVIPLQLILSIAQSREQVPLPPLIEALIMELILEMLREAGVRLPSPIGQTIGVVGGIVIGQAAVQAGIVSNIMVIVVAITAISSYIIPNLEMSAGIRLIRFPMMLLASAFGMVGIVCGMSLLVIHILSISSLGVPYGSPISPLRFSDMKDTFIRLPIWMMKKRPLSVRPNQVDRQGKRRKK
ncbi:spore germination protein [Aneurinibacillus sp. REN35]|uniref:spore germination protein n=1 Tax=Aneurinibacillus sp. REN35 TaxID=3237286 RepID=UPI0035294102